MASTALLVMPGGRDLPYCAALNGTGNQRIRSYVHKGGRYLGFCAGSYYASGFCEYLVGDTKAEVVGKRELGFFPGICRGPVFPAQMYNNERGGRQVKLDVDKTFFQGYDLSSFRCYYEDGGSFVNAHTFQDSNISVIATYTDETALETQGRAAAVHCPVGNGQAVLIAVHPEFAPEDLYKYKNNYKYAEMMKTLKNDTASRYEFLSACLRRIGLSVAEFSSLPTVTILHLTSLRRGAVSQTIDYLRGLQAAEMSDHGFVFKGESDIFSFFNASEVSPALITTLNSSTDSKAVAYYPNECQECPSTTHFDVNLFYNCLKTARKQSKYGKNLFGSSILYGEVVTSTSTMLEKNFELLKVLESGFTAVGSIQIAGRGRGRNVWVNPIGVLAFSTVIRHPKPFQTIAMVQYIAGIAIAAAIRSYGPGYENFPVRLKWPNDIYVLNPKNVESLTKIHKIEDFIKIGGVLVNSTIDCDDYLLVVGCGINTSNPLPMYSLNAVVRAMNSVGLTQGFEMLPDFSMEKLLALIMVKFEDYYLSFLYGGFESLEQLYYSMWLHTGQIVSLESTSGAKARITGVTLDYGLLRTEELNFSGDTTGRKFDLQPDGNSFDMFKGLIKSKN